MPVKHKTTPQKKKLITRLSMWEWETLVASWRYYEHGSTISSASFPDDIIERFWGEGNPYSDDVRYTIAHQFAMTDHQSKGEKDWTDKGCFSFECDILSWTTFYRFCEAWVNGFTPITVAWPEGEQTVHMCFHTDWNDTWYPRDEYIRHGTNFKINPKLIVHIGERETDYSRKG